MIFCLPKSEKIFIYQPIIILLSRSEEKKNAGESYQPINTLRGFELNKTAIFCQHERWEITIIKIVIPNSILKILSYL